jgi:hypothetical protein
VKEIQLTGDGSLHGYLNQIDFFGGSTNLKFQAPNPKQISNYNTQ